jgi:hypothetical protein
MRPLPALAAVLLLAAPAAAQTVTHSTEGRFGVAYAEDARGGDSTARPVIDGQHTMSVRQPWDNGWYFGFSLSVGAGSFVQRGPRAHSDLQPGLRFEGSGS